MAINYAALDRAALHRAEHPDVTVRAAFGPGGHMDEIMTNMANVRYDPIEFMSLVNSGIATSRYSLAHPNAQQVVKGNNMMESKESFDTGDTIYFYAHVEDQYSSHYINKIYEGVVCFVMPETLQIKVGDRYMDADKSDAWHNKDDACKALRQIIADQAERLKELLDGWYDATQKFAYLKDKPIPHGIRPAEGQLVWVVKDAKCSEQEQVRCIPAKVRVADDDTFCVDDEAYSTYYSCYATEEEAEVIAYHFLLDGFMQFLEDAGITHKEYRCNSIKDVEEEIGT